MQHCTYMSKLPETINRKDTGLLYIFHSLEQIFCLLLPASVDHSQCELAACVYVQQHRRPFANLQDFDCWAVLSLSVQPFRRCLRGQLLSGRLVGTAVDGRHLPMTMAVSTGNAPGANEAPGNGRVHRVAEGVRW